MIVLKRKYIFILLLLLLSTGLYGAYTELPVEYSDARVVGMGNTFTAVADDKNMLFFNPAGFADYGLIKTSKLAAILNPTLWKPRYTNLGDLTLASFTYGFDTGILEKYFGSGIPFITSPDEGGPLKKLIDMGYFEKVSDGSLTATEATNGSEYLTQLLYTTFHATVKSEILSYARHYFGFGLFTTSDVKFHLEANGLLLVNPVAQIKNDIVFPIGIGMHIPGYKKWSVGITYKYFIRARAEINNFNDVIALQQFFTGDYLNTDLDSQLKSKSVWELMFHGVNYSKTALSQFKVGSGYGFDVGAMYRPSFAWRYGLLLSDIYTRIKWWDGAESSSIKPNLRIGVAYMPSFSLLGFFEDPIFAVDVEDLFHTQGKNFFLKWHFGTELKFLFRIFRLRAGIQDGYPAVGLGIDFNFYLISKIPLLKYLRPDSVYFPKFNPKDKDFIAKNPFCCCLTGILAPLLYSHIKLDFSYAATELGAYPGDLPSYQFLFKFSLSYSY